MYSLSSKSTQSWLSWFLRGLLALGTLLLIGRLIDLQVIRGNYFRGLSEENRIRRVPITASRGEILARGGEVLVGNNGITKEVVFDKKEGFTKTEVDKGTSGDNIIEEPKRDYKLGASLGHVSGYIGEINQEELGKIEGECPEKGARRVGDIIGRSGLEKQYECTLRGIDGEILFEVDAKSKTSRVLGKKEPIKGADVRTTIDIGLQQRTAEIMKDKKGAAIVTDTKGQILAFFSSPSYDPNFFVSGNPKQLSEILENSNLPLFDRVLGGNFHPGSVFKPIVALAALQEGAIDRDFTYNDTGAIVIKNIYGTYSYKNWFFSQYGGVEGEIGLERALARSTDTFFYKVGELTGPEKIAEWAIKFGLGDKTNVDIPGEIDGLVPSPNWKVEYKNERWFLGDTYNVSIGQGDLAVTPIEINTAIGVIASGGSICNPHFSQGVNSTCKNMNISKENLNKVIKGMEGACTSGGTAYPFFDFFEKTGFKVACKTGTAQNVNEDPHAWFTAFTPSNDPEIVMTILVENGGEGSKVAAPIAREIMNYWVENRI